VVQIPEMPRLRKVFQDHNHRVNDTNQTIQKGAAMKRKNLDQLAEIFRPLLPRNRTKKFETLKRVSNIMTLVDPSFDSLRFMAEASKKTKGNTNANKKA